MTLSHESDGSGPAVLLLHSTVCDRRMWTPQVPALVKAGFRAIRPDLPGYGDTPVPTAPTDVAAEALALTGDGPLHLVGSSGGGVVALEIAARWPSRVASLTLLCTAAPGLVPSPALRALWDGENALLEAGDVATATELNVQTWLGPQASDEARALVREMQSHAFKVQLAADEPDEIEIDWTPDAITARTLLVSGAHDLPDFAAIATSLAASLPQARHVELDWAGHLPSLEDPAKINELLLTFLRSS
ncbi:alpha/beta hydrolase [Actinoplanes bogorensis]|uniref:Alpha/beta hydrolase n=1 Tax=Paractinoplanes bogorensis TaxID=1610840 RepID=A0ABS5YTY5_9ACTN|nr:alpha/beta hydrolase [Actinoplanes bogorensis]MBU2665535.1 alpha/beta hydrolase [Actinoplanes bogorensis]